MGSACCVAARDQTIPHRAGGEALHRNPIDSPSWSFRWDRGHVAGKIENPSYQVSHGISRNVSMELKGSLGSERGNLSDGGSLMENFGTPTSLKSPVHEGVDVNLMTPHSDLSAASIFSAEVKSIAESPEIADSAAPNLSILSMISAFSAPSVDYLPTQSYPVLPNATPSRRARRSPGYQLLRQVSDSRILRSKSPNNNSISEGRPSFVLSTGSNDLATGSQFGSSDGWSIRTFSELVASSQRERWSFDSEHFGSGRCKISGSSSRFSYSPSVELHYCGVCSKLLTERSSWSSRCNEVPVASVLVCGHAYHAECLETITVEADRYDPSCPICMVGEKEVSKMSKAESKSKNHKKSKNRVVDSYLDGDFDVFDRQKDSEHKGKVPTMGSSSSTRSSFAKPFLRRHFSIGSKWSRSLSESDSARKKGFWARYRKD
ncbi:hypothetical protein F2P56_018106 [Juglans regia]|uniref:RING-type domain-containing protein n=2 Tax=Juglans regia TaxID=51240 RepID=A0A833U8L3_JUGRE|nr:uncharacterized protein LOC108997096 [Juglans regia]XP_018828758.1 uncharacterized protein LOC108997096 [Juglans regia]XP_018828759.1 uncharacterized protein LOC108997096 [Juglans regia]XP_035549144.1 uncharacterized protein LOC109015934 [Juglans regia]XP_035549145.1 uncharacterized protein LOC109015934 [Juglans regia]XP_035549146.1 uncharacterized protein LOC109015934 [Juglans regia]KAF5462062.1 hypothetical protein F2P56_018102 [Juglans regia]KAF5462066.1 hypothetical protein F2P56_0181